MIIMLVGPPGSGKGTHSELICQKFDLFPVATGDILREKMKGEDEVSQHIAKLMKAGELLPDEMLNGLVEETVTEHIKKADYKGLLFDGYPRTIKQAEFLEEVLNKLNKKIDKVLVFCIPDDIIIKRLSARRVDRLTGKTYNLLSHPPPADVVCDLYQRIDDTDEAIKNRLEVYRVQTEPLIDFYSKKNLTIEVDVAGDLKDIHSELHKHLFAQVPDVEGDLKNLNIIEEHIDEILSDYV